MQMLIENAEQLDHIILRTGLLSEDQFWDLCAKYPDFDVEVTADGQAIIMAPVGGWTSLRNCAISVQLSGWAKRDGRGLVIGSSAKFHLPNQARRSPDASWMHKSRFPREEHGSWPLCPDFVIELRSRSARGVEKMEEWISNGAGRLAD